MASRPIQRRVRGDEALPTRQAVETAKREAWSRVARHAYLAGWPLNDRGREVLELAPAVALCGLAAACPEVPAERLARCLGLPSVIHAPDVHESWIVEAGHEVAEAIRGGA